MPTKSVKRNDGKACQDIVQEALKSLESSVPSTWVRLYDSHSAGFGRGGNIIPPQPGDFIMLLKGTSVLIEAKSSEVHQSLLECCIKNTFSSEQILGARLHKRAGGKAICVFLSLKTKGLEIWDMSQVIEAFLAKSREGQLKGEPLFSCKRADFINCLGTIV